MHENCSAVMSLADELLADLEEAGGGDEDADVKGEHDGGDDASNDEIDEVEEDDPVERMDTSQCAVAGSILSQL